MIVAAFDIGSNMGMAVTGRAPVHYTVEGRRPDKLLQILQWLHERFEELKAAGVELDVVIYECPFVRGMAATRMLWGIAAVIEAVATYHGYPVLCDIRPGTTKKFGAGRGDATKEDMIAGAFLLGYTGDNEHEADAFCLLKYAESTAISKEKDDGPSDRRGAGRAAEAAGSSQGKPRGRRANAGGKPRRVQDQHQESEGEGADG